MNDVKNLITQASGDVISTGLMVSRPGVRWEIVAGKLDLTATIAALRRLQTVLSADASAIIDYVCAEPMLTGMGRLALIRDVLAALDVWAGRAPLPRAPLKAVVEAVQAAAAAERAYLRDQLFVVDADGHRQIGTVQLFTDLTWWGHMAPWVPGCGGTTLGPHSEADGHTLIERMLCRFYGLPDPLVGAGPAPAQAEAVGA